MWVFCIVHLSPPSSLFAARLQATDQEQADKMVWDSFPSQLSSTKGLLWSAIDYKLTTDCLSKICFSAVKSTRKLRERERILQVLASLIRLITCAEVMEPQHEPSNLKSLQAGSNKVKNTPSVRLRKESAHVCISSRKKMRILDSQRLHSSTLKNRM